MVYEIGEVLEHMNETIMVKELDKKINEVRKDKNWDEFWLIFSMKPNFYLSNVINSVWIACNEKPNPVSNTIHFYINWKQGRIESRVFPPSQSNIYNYPIRDSDKEFDKKRKIGDALNSEFTPTGGVIAR